MVHDGHAFAVVVPPLPGCFLSARANSHDLNIGSLGNICSLGDDTTASRMKVLGLGNPAVGLLTSPTPPLLRVARAVGRTACHAFHRLRRPEMV